MNRMPSVDEQYRARMRDLEHTRKVAEASWPEQFREQCEQNDRALQQNCDQIRSEVGRICTDLAHDIEALRLSHNALSSHVAALRRELEIERTARQALEAIPRQTINLTLPERETNVNIDVPPPNVTLKTPARSQTTIVARDAEGRISRTVAEAMDD